MTTYSPSAAARGVPDRRLLPAIRTRPWPAWLVCLAISAAWFGATLGWRPLAIPDEGRYVGIAWEMLRSGDWLVPTLDGLPFLHKPPLFYWITAASMQWFGPGVAAARLAPWLAAVSIATGLFAFVRRWVDERAAWTTLAVLATMPLFYGSAQFANLDGLVAACIGATILLVAHAALARATSLPYRGALAAAFATAALGVLAKGLIGIVLPFGVLLGWGLATRRAGRLVALMLWPPGWLIGVALVAPWLLAMQARFPDFAHYFFVVQQFQRYATGGFNSAEPWWFCAAALLLLTLPWSPCLAWCWKRERGAADDGADAAAAVHRLMVVWALGVTAFFSLPSSKLVGYLLPALPPLAALVGLALTRARWPRPRLLGATALAAAVCLGAALAAHFHQPKSRQALAEALRAQRLPGEPVYDLGEYAYDVAFYARLDAPMGVVDRWLPADVAQDSWRRELVDAARFAPAAATPRLLKPDALAPALCAAGSGWIVGAWPPAAEPAWLAALAPRVQSGATALWHVRRADPALGCAP